MCISNWLTKYRSKRHIKRLSEAERQEILEKSPFSGGAFQGEGYHVFLKSEPDFVKGYVTSLGEVTGDVAEGWIIRQYLQQQENIKKYGPEKAGQNWIED